MISARSLENGEKITPDSTYNNTQFASAEFRRYLRNFHSPNVADRLSTIDTGNDLHCRTLREMRTNDVRDEIARRFRPANPGEATVAGGQWPVDTLRLYALLISRDQAFPDGTRQYMKDNQMGFSRDEAAHIKEEAYRLYRLATGREADPNLKARMSASINSFRQDRLTFGR